MPTPALVTRAHDRRPGIELEVFRLGDIELGHYRCDPRSRAWSEDNQILDGTLLVVPHRAVEIAQAGRETVVASPVQAVFYRRRQVYRRRLIDPRGDDCVYICLPDATWARVLAALVPAARTWRPGEPLPLPGCRGPVDSPTYLRFAQLVTALERGAAPDRLAFEEHLLTVVGDIVRGAVELRGPTRGRPRQKHVELGRAAEAFVAARYREDWGLDELAAALDASPAHLGRVFRRHVGTSIHQQRIRLRLAAAIELLGDRQRSLTDIAMDLGFASPSHFSSQFRRVLGLPPSALRGAGSRRRRQVAARAGI